MKVFELKIDEEDDLSGIQYISIVKDPATQIAWEVFNNQEEPLSCSHREDLPQEAIDLLDNYGTIVSPEAFFNAEIKDIDELVFETFAVPNINPDPKAPCKFSDDNSDTASVISRYIYVVDTGVGAPLIKTSRQLCRKMLLSQKVWSACDLQKYSVALTSQSDTFKLVPRPHTAPQVDFFTYKSGKYCRHKFVQIDFPIGLNETYEQALAKIPLKAQTALANGTILAQDGRPFQSEWSIDPPKKTGMSAENNLKPIGFHFGLFVYPTRFAALTAEPTAKTITKVKMGDMTGYCPVEITPEYFEGTAEVVEHFKVREAFAVPTKEIQDTAQKVLDWVEENGWGSCGTEVGKVRANQLAKGDNISLETITRMFSYLSRHKKDLEASTSYEDGCGKLMYDSWGGEAALGWAEREMKKATEMNVMFSSDEFKGDITAVVFQPNQKIYRWDSETNTPYYVFMSRDTIRLMLMKLSKNKPKDLINYEHSGMVFSGDEVYSYENWLVGDNPELDKSYEMFGRTFEPGTWMTTIHFNNRKIFDEFILSNKTAGISLEGMFEEVPFNFFDVKKEGFIEPKPGQSKEDYLAECIPYVIKEGATQEQAAGKCYGMWKNKMTDEKFDEGDKVSFDYDDTLSTDEGKKLAIGEIESGSMVYIISARNDKEGMLGTADDLGIPHDRVFATGSNKAKVEKIKELGISKHYDNNQDVIDELGSIGEKFITEYIPYDELADSICGTCDDEDGSIYNYFNEEDAEETIEALKELLKSNGFSKIEEETLFRLNKKKLFN